MHAPQSSRRVGQGFSPAHFVSSGSAVGLLRKVRTTGGERRAKCGWVHLSSVADTAPADSHCGPQPV